MCVWFLVQRVSLHDCSQCNFNTIWGGAVTAPAYILKHRFVREQSRTFENVAGFLPVFIDVSRRTFRRRANGNCAGRPATGPADGIVYGFAHLPPRIIVNFVRISVEIWFCRMHLFSCRETWRPIRKRCSYTMSGGCPAERTDGATYPYIADTVRPFSRNSKKRRAWQQFFLRTFSDFPESEFGEWTDFRR